MWRVAVCIVPYWMALKELCSCDAQAPAGGDSSLDENSQESVRDKLAGRLTHLTANSASSCITCRNGDYPTGAHDCYVCQKNVHALEGCSVVVPYSAEGYGQKRTCLDCAQGIRPSIIDTLIPSQTVLQDSIEPSSSAPPKKRSKFSFMNPTTISNCDKQPGHVAPSNPDNRKANVFDLEPNVTFGQSSAVLCVVCELFAVGNGTLCSNCKKVVHVEECSVALFTGQEVHMSTERICRLCYCSLCKFVKNSGHICVCCVCKQAVTEFEGVVCYRCEKIVHTSVCQKEIVAKEKGNVKKSVCTSFFHALEAGFTISAYNDLVSQKMLSDEHMARASEMILQDYGQKIDGLRSPLAVRYGYKVDKTNHYPVFTKMKDYVQILNTGNEHWVTIIFRKGSSAVAIMDSLRKVPVSGHVNFQVAMIANTQENVITTVRPPCKQQQNTVDCGLFAIANAVEFCKSGTIQNIDFDPSKMRNHWLQCLQKNKISPFPRLSSRPKKSREEDDIQPIKVYCSCRLPAPYGTMVQCDLCCKWYHCCCVGVPDNVSGSWKCAICRDR